MSNSWAEKVIWIPGDPSDIETDGHIDGTAVFIKPGVVLVEVNLEPKREHFALGQQNIAALEGQIDAKSRPLKLEFISEGCYEKVESDKECCSYINSYLPNGAAIVPGYDDTERDLIAVETCQGLFPERQAIQVQIQAIAEGGGGIHCITQQQPKAN